MTYRVSAAGSPTTRFVVAADLGTVLARATYRSAPDA
jgi:hypothetical protein